MGWSAFAPSGKTTTLLVTATTSVPVQALSNLANSQNNNFRVINAGNVGCFLSTGGNSAVTYAEVGGVSHGQTSKGQYLAPNSVEVFTHGPATWFSAITATGTTTLYISPGDGL